MDDKISKTLEFSIIIVLAKHSRLLITIKHNITIHSMFWFPHLLNENNNGTIDFCGLSKIMLIKYLKSSSPHASY